MSRTAILHWYGMIWYGICMRMCMRMGMSVVMRMVEGSLEVKLPTIWTDEKQSRAEAERRERSEEKRVEEKE